MSTVIMANSPREANTYAREKGIRANYAPNAAAVRAATRIIELPSFGKRRDRFEMLSAAQSACRFRNVPYEVDSDWIAPPRVVQPVEEPAQEPTDGEHPFDQVDFADEAVLEQLKLRLNHVGYTLKRLPAPKEKAQEPTPETPTVATPVEF